MAIYDRIVEASRGSEAIGFCLWLYNVVSDYKRMKAIQNYRDAQEHAQTIYYHLELFESNVERELDPERHELIAISEAIRAALREEAGSMPPDEFIETWINKCMKEGTWAYTNQQHEAAKRVAERWADKAKVDEEFWFLGLNIEGSMNRGEPDTNIWEVAEPMQEWLGISPPKLYTKKMDKEAMKARAKWPWCSKCHRANAEHSFVL